MYILINCSWGLGGFGSNKTFVGMSGPCPGPWPKNMHWLPLVCIYLSLKFPSVLGFSDAFRGLN